MKQQEVKFRPWNRRIGRVALALGIACSFGVLPLQIAFAEDAGGPDETWQVIYLSGERVGYNRSLTEPIERDGETLVHTVVESYIRVRRFGQELVTQTRSETIETQDGDLREFHVITRNPPASKTESKGIVEGERLRLTVTVDGRRTREVKPWDKTLKSPAYQDRLLSENPLEPGETRTIKVFVPEFVKPSEVTMTARPREAIALLNSKVKTLLPVAIRQSLMPGVETVVYMDDDGEALKSVTKIVGMEMVTHTVDEATALEELETAEIDFAVNTLIKVDAIPNAHQAQQIVYELSLKTGDPVEALPSGGTQIVERIDDSTARVTVSKAAWTDEATTSKTEDVYLSATRYLQTDDDLIREHVRKAVPEEGIPAGKAARLMERYVYSAIDRKDFSTALASAAEVARTLRGDCTEHAVLLAAMLRAYGIPSRVAIGVVYAPGMSAFGGHMWTEAYLDEQWVPLDATLGQGGIGAGHIKLSVSPLADEGSLPGEDFIRLVSLLGSMKIRVVEVADSQ